jgi:hypothetical protein
LKLSLQNNLHFIVGIGIDQRGTFLQAIEAAGDWLIGIIFVAAGEINVSEWVCVYICDCRMWIFSENIG